MNTERLTTSMIEASKSSEFGGESHVTVRRQTKQRNSKMADPSDRHPYVEDGTESNSLFIDSILTQTETDDVIKMLELEGLTMEGHTGDYQFTSTQMGGKEHRWRSYGLVSPILEKSPMSMSGNDFAASPHFGYGVKTINRFSILGEEDRKGFSEEPSGIQEIKVGRSVENEGKQLAGATEGGRADGGNTFHDDAQPTRGIDDVVNDTKSEGNHSNELGNQGHVTKPESSGEGGKVEGGEDKHADPGIKGGNDGEAGQDKEATTTELDRLNQKVNMVHDSSKEVWKKLGDLQDSLEFSQKEIQDLKAENSKLRQQISDNETEEKRSQLQIKKVEDKVEKLDTVIKKRNLSFEGIPEVRDGKEDVEKTVWDLLDQMKIERGLEMEACYRLGYMNRYSSRPVIVNFVRQADRDLVYSKRAELRHSEQYKGVWINEDLGATSKRKRNLIRLIARQARTEGIDHRTGKYAIHLGKVKYADDNLEELPPPLHPSAVKQIRLDDNTVAYQSENAQFSNFYPCKITIGEYKFIMAEQAFQFLKAKQMNRPLIATKIYLSRNAYDIKQLGEELGTSDTWEQKKFEIMYICVKKKFEQNPHLQQLLLNTGNCELVEATPDRVWGCGATLSSNVLRRHAWPGQNKHGKILMTVREEIARRLSEK